MQARHVQYRAWNLEDGPDMSCGTSVAPESAQEQAASDTSMIQRLQARLYQQSKRTHSMYRCALVSLSMRAMGLTGAQVTRSLLPRRVVVCCCIVRLAATSLNACAISCNNVFAALVLLALQKRAYLCGHLMRSSQAHEPWWGRVHQPQ